jgi:hypothetical protein
MNKDKAKEALKELFNALTGGEKFGTAELEDGTKLKFEGDTLKEGVDLKAEDQSGEHPVKDGTYKLKAGKTIEVKDGKFSKFVEEAPKDDDKKEEMAAAIEALKSDLRKEFAAQIESVVEKFTALETKLETSTKVQKESFSKLIDALEDKPDNAGKDKGVQTSTPTRAWETVALSLKK